MENTYVVAKSYGDEAEAPSMYVTKASNLKEAVEKFLKYYQYGRYTLEDVDGYEYCTEDSKNFEGSLEDRSMYFYIAELNFMERRASF